MSDEQVKRGRLEWDFQIARSHRSLQMWRLLALVMSASTLLLIWYAGSYIQKPKLVPYVVEVQGDQITFKGLVKPTPLTVTDAAVIHYLRRFITDLVSVSTDPVVLKDNLRDTYTIATPQAQGEITRMIVKADPFKASSDGEHVDVRFTEFVKQAEHTWHVEWIEEEWQGSELKAEPAMAGTFTYVTNLPTSEQEAESNPFGLYIDEFFIAPRSAQ